MDSTAPRNGHSRLTEVDATACTKKTAEASSVWISSVILQSLLVPQLRAAAQLRYDLHLPCQTRLGEARAFGDGELIGPGWVREPDGREEELRVTLSLAHRRADRSAVAPRHRQRRKHDRAGGEELRHAVRQFSIATEWTSNND